MIRKSDLIDAMNSINYDLLSLSFRVNRLEKKAESLENKIKNNKEETSLDKKIDSYKSKKAKSQLRDKTGKFVKKK